MVKLNLEKLCDCSLLAEQKKQVDYMWQDPMGWHMTGNLHRVEKEIARRKKMRQKK